MGTHDSDVFLSSAGDDIVDGKEGGDTYYYVSGAGHDQIVDTGVGSGAIDTLYLSDLLRSNVSFARTAEDVLITDNVTQQVIRLTGQFASTVKGLERLIFADGEEWNRQAIQANVTVFVGALNGTLANDTLNGTSTNDILIGREGNDVLYGKDGSDIYVFTRGDGQDTIDDNGLGDTDVLRLYGYTPEEVVVGRSGATATVVLTFVGTADRITLVNEVNSLWDTIEQIQFDDGTVWTELGLRTRVITGTANGETLTGTANSDLLVGLGGADMLTGGAGNDTFVFRGLAVSHDTITDFSAGAGLEDRIEIDTFDSFDEILTALSQHGTDAVISIDANNSITLANVLTTDLHQDDFRFV